MPPKNAYCRKPWELECTTHIYVKGIHYALCVQKWNKKISSSNDLAHCITDVCDKFNDPQDHNQGDLHSLSFAKTNFPLWTHSNTTFDNFVFLVRWLKAMGWWKAMRFLAREKIWLPCVKSRGFWGDYKIIIIIKDLSKPLFPCWNLRRNHKKINVGGGIMHWVPTKDLCLSPSFNFGKVCDPTFIQPSWRW